MPAALEAFLIFLRLGLTSFGGPIAHLGYFRTEFVERRAWLSEAAYADLVALCQFLPGPASSQVGFALGLKRAGVLGGLAAWLGFTAPSALIMFAVASGLEWFAGPWGQAVAHGLKLVAVAVVAHAVFNMARALCRTWPRIAIAVAVAAALLAFQLAWLQPAAIALGGLIGLWFATAPAPQTSGLGAPGRFKAAWILTLLFLALLLGLPLLAAAHPLIAIADAFYRAGALVFGGGHVVLPLLEAETVERGWLSADAFLTGYGAAQAVPGPLFTFAAFLGAAGPGSADPAWASLIALIFVFLPGLLLVAAAMPVWDAVKSRPRALAFVAGANAAVVGVLGAALYDPIIASAVAGPRDLALACLGFLALQLLKAPPWSVVLGLGAAGAALSLAANLGL